MELSPSSKYFSYIKSNAKRKKNRKTVEDGRTDQILYKCPQVLYEIISFPFETYQE
jgi:hypothetical protein